MQIRVYLDGGRLMLLNVTKFEMLKDLADKYNRWEYC